MKIHYFTNLIRKRRKARRQLKSELIVVILAIISIFFSVFFLFSSYQLKAFAEKVPDEAEIFSKVTARTENSKLYDRNGILLYEFKDPNQDREYAKLEEVPEELLWVLLSAEDLNFYQHEGIDFAGILRSINIYVTSEGETVVGGSTITQQLVKNTVLTNEKTLERKSKEIFIAFLIENRYSKREILEMYVNSISFGGNVVGVKTAARTYFSKELKDLTFEESVFLVSLIQLPGQASPLFSNNEQLAWDIVEERKNYIYNQINENYELIKTRNKDFLNLKEINESKDKVIKLVPNIGDIRAAHFVFYIKELLLKTHQINEEQLGNGGYKIYTSLDYRIQQIAEAKIKEGAERFKAYGFANAALVTLDPATGEILAMVGSKDYFSTRNSDGSFDPYVNVALSERNLGSSLKPFIAYEAFKQGKFKPNTLIKDEPTKFEGNYKPKNYDGKFMGEISVRTALIESRNIPFVKIAKEVGVENILNLLFKLGYQNAQYKNRYGLSIALGGFSSNLLEHTHGYTVFANNGSLAELNPILSINDFENKEIYRMKLNSPELLDKENIQQVDNILQEYGIEGIGGKTGTTDSNRDNYFIGYNSKMVTGIWVGNNNNKRMTSRAFGSTTALPIWNMYFSELTRHFPEFKDNT